MRSALIDGPTLRRLRVERMISCAELARMTGLARSFLKYLEAGERGGSPVSRQKLANALDVAPEDLGPITASPGEIAA